MLYNKPEKFSLNQNSNMIISEVMMGFGFLCCCCCLSVAKTQNEDNPDQKIISLSSRVNRKQSLELVPFPLASSSSSSSSALSPSSSSFASPPSTSSSYLTAALSPAYLGTRASELWNKFSPSKKKGKKSEEARESSLDDSGHSTTPVVYLDDQTGVIARQW